MLFSVQRINAAKLLLNAGLRARAPLSALVHLSLLVVNK